MNHRITKEIQIDAGHRVSTHGGACRRIHGHRYRIIAEVETAELVQDQFRAPDSGMVVDFGELKQVMRDVIEARYDHRLILWEQDDLLANGLCDLDHLLRYVIGEDDDGIARVRCIPTAENLACLWYTELHAALEARGFRARLSAVIVWETPTSSAEYRP